ncbi:MAG: hypothetical protein FWD83_05940 [Promicromonosporaceae bacterium]|nr:hypothetical protein [Promicromonosporaceae bacterium]
MAGYWDANSAQALLGQASAAAEEALVALGAAHALGWESAAANSFRGWVADTVDRARSSSETIAALQGDLTRLGYYR